MSVRALKSPALPGGKPSLPYEIDPNHPLSDGLILEFDCSAGDILLPSLNRRLNGAAADAESQAGAGVKTAAGGTDGVALTLPSGHPLYAATTTLSCWWEGVITTANAGAYQSILAVPYASTNGPPYHSWNISANITTGVLRVYTAINSTTNAVATSSTVLTAGYHQLGATQYANNLELYLDGVLIASSSGNAAIDWGQKRPVVVGNSLDGLSGGGPIAGISTRARFWNRRVTADEFRALWADGNGGV